MKRILVVLAFATAFCITDKAQAQLNIHVGYAPEFMKTSTPTHDTTLFYNGFLVGLDWTFKLTDKLSLTAGAQYRMDMKDSSNHYWEGELFVHDTYRDRQGLVDVPILLKYNIPVSNTVTISPFVGPMLSWGIKGTTTETITYPANVDRQYDWYGSNGMAYRPNSRFNLYAKAGVEFSFKRFTLSLSGRYGFLDLNKRITGTMTKSYGFSVGFGHTF